MRVAVLSDIHGNAAALAAVLADIARHDVEKILNLGDHFAGPLDPLEVARMLEPLDMLAIRGNTDRYLVEGNADMLDPHDQMALRALQGRPLEWLRTLPTTAVYDDTIFLSHGSPRSDEVYWLDRKMKKQGMRLASEDEIVAELPDRTVPIYCCGHTNIARVVKLIDGRIVLNPGSVGRPSFNMSDPESSSRRSPAAAYGILEHSSGKWNATLRQVGYDHMAVAALARAHGSEKWARDIAGGRER